MQSANPMAHAPMVHLLITQVFFAFGGGGQTLPHIPQLLMSVAVSWQLALQHVSAMFVQGVAMLQPLAHAPLAQISPALQSFSTRHCLQVFVGLSHLVAVGIAWCSAFLATRCPP